ncbi:rod-binding protein [Rhodovulum sp. YNF3179]|uniref:rod-binding protein n=1 Tax=Rhodovulum sp. YNF3179 TaxID=3425127 RepID=UPI003D348379
MQITPHPAAPPPALRPETEDRLRDAARALEASFISQMLKSAGLGETPSAFGGGAGEDQFASFLRDAQARALAEAGGFGLAESIFESLKGRADDPA